MKSKTPKAPVPGETITVRGEPCKVVRVYRAGTCDVVSLCGRHAWRVTGLGFP